MKTKSTTKLVLDAESIRALFIKQDDAEQSIAASFNDAASLFNETFHQLALLTGHFYSDPKARSHLSKLHEDFGELLVKAHWRSLRAALITSLLKPPPPLEEEANSSPLDRLYFCLARQAKGKNKMLLFSKTRDEDMANEFEIAKGFYKEFFKDEVTSFEMMEVDDKEDTV